MAAREHILPHIASSDFAVSLGDYFHTQLSLGTQSSLFALRLARDICEVAVKNGVVLRILQGTFSHDRLQNNDVFVALSEKLGGNIEVVSKLSLEHIKPLDVKVLYIPDNLPYKSDRECMDVIHKMLSDAGWSGVDYILGHGYVDYVFPPGAPRTSCIFSRKALEKITSKWIAFGHVHSPSSRGKTHYVGSFERMAHGEEENKGFMTFHDSEDGYVAERIKNEYTTAFRTYVPKSSSPEKEIPRFQSWIIKHFVRGPNSGQYLRIKSSDIALRGTLQESIPDEYRISVSTVSSKEDTGIHELNLDDSGIKESNVVTPTRENLVDLTMAYLSRMGCPLQRETVEKELGT